MSVTSSSFAIQAEVPIAALQGAAPASDRAAAFQVRSAVSTLNQSQTAGAGREFSIAIDSKTKQPIVRIVDSSTRELIEQIPSQTILDLAQELSGKTASNSSDSVR